jgi:hypothetical protein
MRRTAAETSGPIPSPGMRVTRCIILATSMTLDYRGISIKV